MPLVRWIGTRSLVVYVLIFLAVNTLVDHRAIEQSADFRQRHRHFAPQILHLLQAHARGSTYLTDCISYFESFVDYVPNGTYANDLLGYCYARDGRYEEAIRAFKIMAELKPGVFWYSYNLGILYRIKGRYPDAEGWFKQARQQQWEVTMDYLTQQKGLYGNLLEKGGDRKRLEERFVNARYHTYQLLILINAHLKDHEDMLQMAREAIGQGLDSQGKFSFYAGLASFKLARYEESMEYFDNCLQKEFLPAQANFYRARIMESLGRNKEAGELMQEAVAYNEEELSSYLEQYPAQPQLF